MTLYFDDSSNAGTLTVSVANVSPVSDWSLLLSSEYAHKLTPKDPDAANPEVALDMSVAETNVRYTTFNITDNSFYKEVKENFYNGIYNIKIMRAIGTENEANIYEGTIKLITQASQDSTKNIKKYESDDESGSSYVLYSDKL